MIKHGYLKVERGHKITNPSGAAGTRRIELHQGGDGGKLYIHSDAVELFVLLGTSDAITASDAYTDPDTKGWTYRIAMGADMTVRLFRVARGAKETDLLRAYTRTHRRPAL